MVQNTDLQVKAYSENLAPILVPSLLLPSFPTGNFFKWFILFKKQTSHIHTHMLSPPSSCPHFSSFIKQDILETIPGLYGDGACFPPPNDCSCYYEGHFCVLQCFWPEFHLCEIPRLRPLLSALFVLSVYLCISLYFYPFRISPFSHVFCIQWVCFESQPALFLLLM